MRENTSRRDRSNNPKSNWSCFFYHRPSPRPGGGPGGPGKGAPGGAPANAGGNAGGPLNPSGPGGPLMAPGVPGPGLGLKPAGWPPGAGIGGKPGAPGGNGKFGGKPPGGGGGRPWPPGGGGMPGRGGRLPGPGAPGNGGGKGRPRPPGAVKVLAFYPGVGKTEEHTKRHARRTGSSWRTWRGHSKRGRWWHLTWTTYQENLCVSIAMRFILSILGEFLRNQTNQEIHMAEGKLPVEP